MDAAAAAAEIAISVRVRVRPSLSVHIRDCKFSGCLFGVRPMHHAMMFWEIETVQFEFPSDKMKIWILQKPRVNIGVFCV